MKPAVVFLVGVFVALNAVVRVTSECPIGCPMEYDPVCGSDGETYPSACDLGIVACNNPSRNITMKFEGDCADGPPPTPPAPTTPVPETTAPAPTIKNCCLPCTKVFVPVCGSNGKTYANYCGLLQDKCRHPKLFKRHSGVCKSKTKS